MTNDQQKAEAYEERLAIMVIDGEMPESKAEWMAWGRVAKEFSEETKECSKKPGYVERLEKLSRQGGKR